jgi:hypothetical protein
VRFPPRPGKTGDELAAHRIAGSSEDNGDGSGRLLGGMGLDRARNHDDVNLKRNQFCRQDGEPLQLPLGMSVFHHNIATFDVAEFTQSRTEGL